MRLVHVRRSKTAALVTVHHPIPVCTRKLSGICFTSASAPVSALLAPCVSSDHAEETRIDALATATHCRWLS